MLFGQKVGQVLTYPIVRTKTRFENWHLFLLCIIFHQYNISFLVKKCFGSFYLLTDWVCNFFFWKRISAQMLLVKFLWNRPQDDDVGGDARAKLIRESFERFWILVSKFTQKKKFSASTLSADTERHCNNFKKSLSGPHYITCNFNSQYYNLEHRCPTLSPLATCGEWPFKCGEWV